MQQDTRKAIEMIANTLSNLTDQLHELLEHTPEEKPKCTHNDTKRTYNKLQDMTYYHCTGCNMLLSMGYGHNFRRSY